jgi:hypothetical protein
MMAHSDLAISQSFLHDNTSLLLSGSSLVSKKTLNPAKDEHPLTPIAASPVQVNPAATQVDHTSALWELEEYLRASGVLQLLSHETWLAWEVSLNSGPLVLYANLLSTYRFLGFS